MCPYRSFSTVLAFLSASTMGTHCDFSTQCVGRASTDTDIDIDTDAHGPTQRRTSQRAVNPALTIPVRDSITSLTHSARTDVDERQFQSQSQSQSSSDIPALRGLSARKLAIAQCAIVNIIAISTLSHSNYDTDNHHHHSVTHSPRLDNR